MRSKGGAVEGVVVHMRLSGYSRSLGMSVGPHRAGRSWAAHAGRGLGLHAGRAHHAGGWAHGMRTGVVRRADHVGARVVRMRRGPTSAHVRVGGVRRAAHHPVGRHGVRAWRRSVEVGPSRDTGVRRRRAPVGRRGGRLGRRQAGGAGGPGGRERRQRAIRHVVELG